ncbi:hypothetical protein AOA62_11235 [Pseudomonas sp. 2995-3]|nr:hypothetical protein AOA62_11235 [Pseudomonas sp. 2995-3]
MLGDTPDIPGIDLKHIASCAWVDHQNHFVEMTLMQGIMMFEEWCGDFANMFVAAGLKIKAESFQFPGGHINKKYTNWIKLDAPGAFIRSALLECQVQPAFMKKNASNVASLDGLLNWYRYFKSVRNSLAHGGGILDQYSLDLYNVAVSTTLKSLGMSRDYSSPAPIVGSRADISLPDSLLLLGVVQRIAFAFDAKYCNVAKAEEEVESRVVTALQKMEVPINVSVEQKNRWLRKLWVNATGTSIKDVSKVEEWFTHKGLVTIKVF